MTGNQGFVGWPVLQVTPPVFSAVAISTGTNGTVLPTSTTMVVVTVTGIGNTILSTSLVAGTVSGQEVVVANTSASVNVIAFGPSDSTARVYNSLGLFIAQGQAVKFTWDATSKLWYWRGSADAEVTPPNTLSNGITINPRVYETCAPFSATGPVTGIIMAAGSYGGQRYTVINTGAAANSFTFAASGTSRVADGTSDVIAGLSARTFTWDNNTALWYPSK